MTTTTTTQVELSPIHNAPHSSITNRTTSNTSSTHSPPPPNILQESQLADAQVPEGGYGWTVILSCSFLNFWGVGILYGWGIIQAALVKDGLASPSTLAFVGSLMAASTPIFGIGVAKIVPRLGARWSAVVAVVCLSVGAVGSGWATGSVGGLFVGTGLGMGLGMTFCFIVASVLPTQYFHAKRGIAYGIVHGGTGLGGATLSFVVSALIEKLGVAWTYRIIGLATFGTALPVALLIKERVPIRRSGLVEWTLFKDIRFILLFLTGMIGTFSLFVPPFFLPLFTAAIGLSPSAGAGIVAACNFSSAIGRIMFGYACDTIGPINSLFLTLLISAFSLLVIWPASTTLAPTLTFAIVNGVSNGGWFSCISMVVGNTFGSLRVATAMGMIVPGWTFGYILGAPIAGFILQASGGNETLKAFRPAIIWAGAMALVASGLVALVRLHTNRRILAKV